MKTIYEVARGGGQFMVIINGAVVLTGLLTLPAAKKAARENALARQCGARVNWLRGPFFAEDRPGVEVVCHRVAQEKKK